VPDFVPWTITLAPGTPIPSSDDVTFPLTVLDWSWANPDCIIKTLNSSAIKNGSFVVLIQYLLFIIINNLVKFIVSPF
jgi:hypothetical protein